MQTTLLAFESFRIHLFREVVVLAFFFCGCKLPKSVHIYLFAEAFSAFARQSYGK